MRRLLAATTLLLAFSAPASALTEAEVEAAVTGYLDSLRDQMAPATLEHGPLAIQPAAGPKGGEGFRVTLPAVAIRGIEDLQDLAIGDISFLVGESEPGSYDFSDVTMPERLSFRDATGAELGTLTFDLRRASGTYSSLVSEFTQLDVALAGYDLRVPAESLVVWIGQAEGKIETRPDGAGFHRQQQDYHLSDLVISDDEGALEMGGARLLATFEGLNLEAYGTLVDIMADVERAAEKGDTARLDALRQAMAELAAQDPVATKLDQSFVITDISGSGEGGKPFGTLAEFAVGLTSEASRGSDVGSATLSLDGKGLALDPAGLPEIADYLPLIPRDWHLPVRLEELPVTALSAALVDLLFSMSLDPLQSDEKLADAGDGLMKVLGAAGSRLVIEGMTIESELLRVTTEAALAFDPKTPFGMVGTVASDYFGLDRVLAFAEKLTDPEANRYLSMIVLGMMGTGQAAAQPDGTVGYRFQFFLTPEGEVTMNGIGMGELLNKAVPQ